jgi:1,4-dihydroxy-2-naphthoyl-CoA synthase
VTSTIEMQRPAGHLTRIVRNGPEVRTAQATHPLYQLNDAFDTVTRDDETSAIMLEHPVVRLSSDARVTRVYGGTR